MPLSPSQSKICFFFQDTNPTLPNRTGLKSFIQSIFGSEKKKLGSLNYIFCTDKALLEINRQFLQHDYYTDIISFELSGKGDPIQAEIYISVDRVKENALTHGVSFRSELHRVIFHGALHLCGYRDKKKPEKALMTQKEDQYLSSYFK
jgi:probable rRNA maturation factor